MGDLLRVVYWLLCCFRIHHCQFLNDDERLFIHTLQESYDDTSSFHENFYTLLGIICPLSVYCQNDNSSDYGINTIGFQGADTLPDMANFSESFSNNQTSVIAEARTILKRNSRYLQGLCTPCFCENDCIEKQNCCPLMANRSEETGNVQPKGQIYQECVIASITSYLKTANFIQVSAGAGYLMVTDCFSANDSEHIATKCRQPNPEQENETKPMYSASTGRIYKNEYCASCNHDNQVTPWISVVTIDQRVSFTGRYRLPSTPEEIYSQAVRTQKLLSIVFIPPPNMPQDAKNECFVTENILSEALCSENNELDNKDKIFLQENCKYRQHPFYCGDRRFENVFCFLCHRPIYGPTEVCSPDSKGGEFSFSAILNSTPSNNASVLDNIPCNCAEYFDEKKKRCRQLFCAPGEIFVDCSCRPFLQDIAHMPVKIFIEIVPEVNALGIHAEQLLQYKPNKNVIKAVVNALKKKVSHFGPLQVTASSLFRETIRSDRISFKLINFIQATFTSLLDDKMALKGLFKALSLGVSVRILGTPMKMTLGRILKMPDMRQSTATQINNSSDFSDSVLERLWPEHTQETMSASTLSKLLYCTRVRLDASEIELLQNNSEAVGLTQPYLSYVFWKEDESMCLEDFEAAFIPGNSGNARITNALCVWFGVWLYFIEPLFCTV